MKKIYSLILIAVSALLAFSCAKEVAESFDVGGEEEEISLVTYTPGFSEKTVLGDEIGHKSISWAENDKVKVYYGTATSASKEAVIENDGEINIKVAAATYKNFFAVYPSTAVAKMVNATSVVGSVTVPQVQNGKFEDACLMTAWATEERILRFHTAVSMITIDVEDPEITKIVIRANDSTPIAGPVEFTFDKATGEITNVTHTKTCTPEVTLNVSGAGKYYVGLLPDADLKAGIGFKVVKGEVESGALSRTPLPLKRTELMSIGKVEDKVFTGGDIFIKANGIGKGTSWGDAGGLALLNSLLDARVSEDVCFDGVTTSWKLSGRKIHIAQGDYNLTGVDMLPLLVACGNGAIEVIGGYSEGSIGTDLSQYDPENCPTVFLSDNGVRIMEVVGLEGGSLSMHGIRFNNANTAADGAAVTMDSPGTVLNLADCYFENNTTTKNGAGLYVAGGTANLTGCSFNRNQGVTAIPASKEETDEYHNQTSHGGAIFASGTDAKLRIDHCMFRNNLAFVGADIELWYGASAFAYDTAFLSGVAQAGSYFGIYPGRTINADAMKNGDVGKLCLCNCTLSKTGSAYTTNGGLPLITATNYFLLLANCTLHDNAVATVRNNNNSDRAALNPDLVWLVANLFVNSDPKGNAINLHKSSNRHGSYNMLRSGKNSYEELDPTDTKIEEADFQTLKYVSEKGYYSWSVDEALHPINRPTKSYVETLVTEQCAEFNDWLQSVSENPYGLDQIGTTRNPGAVCPGSWDKGL